MQCKKGITTSSGLVPCGQCMNCRINYSRNWTSRILMEHVAAEVPGQFLTLTYNDDHVPQVDGVSTLRKAKTLKWLKNVARDVGPFRYYIVGEYGDESLRPHYHLALFPRSHRQGAAIAQRWKKGFTSTYPLVEERAAYLAQYATKKLTKDTDTRLVGNQEPEFRSSSRSPYLGAAFVPILVQAYRSKGGRQFLDENGDIERSWRIGRRVFPIPRIILRDVRRNLEIPELHEERLCHPGYFGRYATKEAATWEPTIAVVEEGRINAKKKANRLRFTSQTI